MILRDATVSDFPRLAHLHVLTFRQTHGGGLKRGPGISSAFATGQSRSEAELGEFRGELNKIYLLREYHGRGLGRRLLCGSARRFLDRGVTSMLLFGDQASRFNGFYEVMGAERLFASAGQFHGGYGWRDLHRDGRISFEACARPQGSAGILVRGERISTATYGSTFD